MTERLNTAQPYAIGLFRIVTGLLFLCHGAASLFGVLGGAAGTDGGTISAGTWPGWYAAVIQLIGGGLVMLGLGTRGAALVASGSMAYAYFSVHQPVGLWPMMNGGEAAAMFCWALFLLVFTGSGALGLDALFARRGEAERRPEASAERQESPVAA
ncbi:DoxX family protein [Streptomyces sp. TRM70350]|uniref:DoxX family protein n=1 Tax=Streptomyces sp. TRM70350 TaxID=2856165 RepID=UPI001C45FFF4|nr:DoxX family protein [Streptomyces sp. TRM70350]MBV7698432.1 DoxX family protein [Streptomyces sp. TRM70350]